MGIVALCLCRISCRAGETAFTFASAGATLTTAVGGDMDPFEGLLPML